MSDEMEMRRHRCCFAGHRPEKLTEDEAAIKTWLSCQIDDAIHDGFETFLTGMAMGIDIWAGMTVLEKKAVVPGLHLIAVTPYPGFPAKWKENWKEAYDRLWHGADHRVIISPSFTPDAFERRNRFLVDHASRLIAFYNGEEGGTHRLITYARESGLACFVHTPSDRNV